MDLGFTIPLCGGGGSVKCVSVEGALPLLMRPRLEDCQMTQGEGSIKIVMHGWSGVMSAVPPPHLGEGSRYNVDTRAFQRCGGGGDRD